MRTLYHITSLINKLSTGKSKAIYLSLFIKELSPEIYSLFQLIDPLSHRVDSHMLHFVFLHGTFKNKFQKIKSNSLINNLRFNSLSLIINESKKLCQGKNKKKFLTN